MECKITNDLGTISITEDVLLRMAGYAALEEVLAAARAALVPMGAGEGARLLHGALLLGTQDV